MVTKTKKVKKKMMKFEDYREQIDEYCALHGIDVQKLFKLPKARSFDYMYFLYPDADDTPYEELTIGGDPMPIVLDILKQDDGSLLFEPTEYIEHYKLHPAAR